MEKRDLSNPQQRVGVETCFRSCTLRAPRPGSTTLLRLAKRGLSRVPHRRFHPPTRTAERVSPQRLKLPPEITRHSLQGPFPFYERIYLHKERVRDYSLI